MKTADKPILFYDMETFMYNTVMVFKKENKEVVKIFHNNFDGLKELCDNYRLIGYNNDSFDDKILNQVVYSGLSDPTLIYHLGQDIINEQTEDGEFSRFSKGWDLDTFDVYKACSVKGVSLKRFEGFFGMSIVESAIDFHVDRPLTDSELQEVVAYCCYDVDATIDAFYNAEPIPGNTVEAMYQIQCSLVDEYGGRVSYKHSHWINKLFPLPHQWDKTYVPVELINKVKNPELRDFYLKGKIGKLTTIAFDNEVIASEGGIHSTHNTLTKKLLSNVKLLDFASLYPYIMIIFKILEQHTDKYETILKQRIQHKQEGNPIHHAEKIILNSVYGNLKNKYSKLYDPNKSLTICHIGQCLLLIITERLYEIGCTIIQLNTDGVAYLQNDVSDEEVLRVWKEFEAEFGFNLELDEYEKFFQSNVNNYVALQNGKIKAKGGLVYNYEGTNYLSNNNAIIDLMLVNKILFEKPFHETILENTDNYKMYQTITNVTRKFKYCRDDTGKVHQKVNRLFATKTGLTKFVKVKDVDGEERETKFSDLPKTFTIFNDALDNACINLDYNHYMKLAEKKYKKFTS